jgi:hypothetical protein
MNFKVFPKINISPIIIETPIFLDIFKRPNAYVELNPSMYINEEGECKILIRAVNYRKFINKYFTLYGYPSNSIYFLLTGKVDKKLDLENFEKQRVNHTYNLPTFKTHWTGLEDIRFINENKILAAVPECNSSGEPCIFKAEIKDNLINNFIKCEPSIKEKNWMPYNNCKLIYSLNPFQIKSIETNDLEEIEIDNKYKNILNSYHGSTNGILFNKEYLFLIHENIENKVFSRWLLFDEINKKIKLSERFVFFKESYLEFVCSLCKYQNRYFISIGVNDCKAFIIELDEKDIVDSLG